MEKELTPKSMTLAVLNQMDYGGSNPLNRTTMKLCLAKAYILITGLTAILMTLNLLFTKHDTVGKFVEDTEMFFGFVQICNKYAVCVYRASALSKLLHNIWTEFWPLDIMTDSKQKKEMQTLYRLIVFASKMYKYLTVAATLSFIAQTVAKRNRSFITDIWTPFPQKLKESPYYELMFGFQVVMFPTSIYFGMIQIDMLFIIMLGLVYVQFRMLKYKLLTINEFNSVDTKLINECIFHHDMLLRFLKRFETVYSASLLPTFGSTMLLATLSMYAVVNEETLPRKLSFVSVYLAAILQIFAYCYAGHLVQDEGDSVGQAAYECDWSSVQNRDVKIGLIMIILRSQRKIDITAGGIMILSMESFTKVARASFSFLTFIVNMRT